MIKQSKNITTRSYSTINILKDQNKITDQNLIAINRLTLEDLIAIKLELSVQHVNHRLYGLDIWRAIPHIAQEATMKFAISATTSKKDASRFLGLTYLEFLNIYKRYNLKNFFDTTK